MYGLNIYVAVDEKKKKGSLHSFLLHLSISLIPLANFAKKIKPGFYVFVCDGLDVSGRDINHVTLFFLSTWNMVPFPVEFRTDH